MKLPDFTLHTGLNELRRKMGADLIELVQEDSEWKRLSLQLENEGIDVAFDEVEIQKDFTFEYQGQKVVVYIRDQHAHVLERGGEYKFHIAQCYTLETMRQKNRDNRYVVTNRKDGKFVVNIIRKGSTSAESREMPMKVCKNCISTLCLGVTPDTFSLEAFFAKYSSQIKRVPKHTEKTAPLNLYTSDWREVANRVKKGNDWYCDECDQSFKTQKELLHVHHVDGNKSNNTKRNLRVLCAGCHAEQDGHDHMKATRDYARALRVTLFPPGQGSRVAEEKAPGYPRKRD